MMYLVIIVTHMQVNWNFQLCHHLTVTTAENFVMICWMVAEIWAYGIVDQLVALNHVLSIENPPFYRPPQYVKIAAIWPSVSIIGNLWGARNTTFILEATTLSQGVIRPASSIMWNSGNETAYRRLRQDPIPKMANSTFVLIFCQ